MEYNKRLQLAIDALKDANDTTNPLRHIFNLDSLIAELERRQRLLNLALDIKNEPMSKPQFLQCLIQDIDPRDPGITYEEYLQAFDELKYDVAIEKIQAEMAKGTACGVLYELEDE